MRERIEENKKLIEKYQLHISERKQEMAKARNKILEIEAESARLNKFIINTTNDLNGVSKTIGQLFQDNTDLELQIQEIELNKKVEELLENEPDFYEFLSYRIEALRNEMGTPSQIEALRDVSEVTKILREIATNDKTFSPVGVYVKSAESFYKQDLRDELKKKATGQKITLFSKQTRKDIVDRCLQKPEVQGIWA